jgi:hypothetical protein
MDGEFWFKPKAFGYGATPVTWEGWAVVVAYVVVVAAIAILMARRERGFAAAWAAWVVALAIATSTLTWVSAVKTDGAWQWRWGHIESSGKAS